MNLEKQIIFFLSALGAFNGFLLSFYFAYIAPKKKFSNYFLALLLLTLSTRIAKSVFFYFNPNLSGVFIQIGLSACVLIGPFLYLYLQSFLQNKVSKWAWHILPFLLVVTALGVLYPYVEYRPIWQKWIVTTIYLQWFVYIIFSFKFVKSAFQRIFNKREKASSIDIWLASIYTGVGFIWLGYQIGSYTSYIVGAMSSSFVLYLIILLFIFRSRNAAFFEEKEKYKNKPINQQIASQISVALTIVYEKELFRNADLTLSQVAQEIKVTPQVLSQFLNDNLGKSFPLFLNELRIEKAKELLLSDTNYTIEALGYESGFNSKSTFFTTFKKFTGKTPSAYRKAARLSSHS